MQNTQQNQENFITLFEKHINDIKDNKILTLKSSTYAKGTYYNYRSAVVNLKKYEEKTSKKLVISDINNEFINKFIIFMYSDLYYTKNAAASIIKPLLAFTNRYPELNIKLDKIHLSEKVTNTYLSTEEIDKISSLKLNKSFSVYRDILIFLCYTGLRYSDLQRLIENGVKNSIEKHDKGCVIVLRAKKNKEPIVIPLSPAAYDIVYSDNLKKRTIISCNKKIKIIAKVAGITQEVIRSRTEAGVMTDKKFKKYQLITTKTGRVSFVTNLLLQGVPAFQIRRMTGHRSEQAFNSYISTLDLPSALSMFEYDYFNNKKEEKNDSDKKSLQTTNEKNRRKILFWKSCRAFIALFRKRTKNNT